MEADKKAMYLVRVRCTNCQQRYDKAIPWGVPVHQASCDGCGCSRTLEPSIATILGAPQ